MVKTVRIKYIVLRIVLMANAAKVINILSLASNAAEANNSFETKPIKPGIPTMLNAPMVKAKPAIRFLCADPRRE